MNPILPILYLASASCIWISFWNQFYYFIWSKTCFHELDNTQIILLEHWAAQSSGAVEYADCISAEQYPLLKKKRKKKEKTYKKQWVPLDLQMVKLKFLSFGNTEYRFIAITPRGTLIQSGSTC